MTFMVLVLFGVKIPGIVVLIAVFGGAMVYLANRHPFIEANANGKKVSFDENKSPVMTYIPDDDLIMGDPTYVPTPSFSRTAFREGSEA